MLSQKDVTPEKKDKNIKIINGPSNHREDQEVEFKNCAANFSFAQLDTRKSLGRSKPTTNSQAQAPQHTVWNIFTISKSYRTAFYRNIMSTTRCE